MDQYYYKKYLSMVFKPRVNKQLAKYVRTGELNRFDKGVYCVPKCKTKPQKVIERIYKQ